MITIRGHEIPTDAEGRINLTEIWKLWKRSSGKKNRRPGDFKRRKLIRWAIQTLRDWQTTRGRGSATWASLALAEFYAEYLDLEYARPKPCPADTKHEEFMQRMAERAARAAAERAVIEENLRKIREQTAAEQAAREQEPSQEPGSDDEQAWVFHGEGWKGEYDPDTAGEEWKKASQEDPEAPYYAPGTIYVPGRGGRGPDGLFFDYFLGLSGCCN